MQTTAAATAEEQSWKSDPWLGVNPIDPAFRADPYPFLYARNFIDLMGSALPAPRPVTH